MWHEAPQFSPIYQALDAVRARSMELNAWRTLGSHCFQGFGQIFAFTRCFCQWDLWESLSGVCNEHIGKSEPLIPVIPSVQCWGTMSSCFAVCACFFWGSVSAPGAHRASFFSPFPTCACFCPPSRNNQANFGQPAVAALSYNVGVVGNDACFCNCAWSHICETDSLVPVCGDTTPGCPPRSIWGTSLGEDNIGVRARILNPKVTRRARAGQTFPPSCIC